jgi:hypothetical protein
LIKNASPSDELKTLLPASDPATSKSKSPLVDMAGEWAVMGLFALVLSGIGAGLVSLVTSRFMGDAGIWIFGVILLLTLGLVPPLLKKETRTLLFGFAILAVAWIGVYLAVTTFTPWSTLFGRTGSFGSIFSVTIIAGTLGYLVAQGKRWGVLLDLLRVRTARKLTVQPDQNAMQLTSGFGTLDGSFLRRPAESGSDSSYSALHNTLSDETQKLLSYWTHAQRHLVKPRATGRGDPIPEPLPVEIALLDSVNAQTSWEALLDPALFVRPWVHPLGMYRTVPLEFAVAGIRDLNRLEPTLLSALTADKRPARRRPVTVATQTFQGWKPLANWQRSGTPLAKLGLRNIRITNEGGQAEIVHLVGNPSVVRDGVRLEIDGEERKERGTLLDAKAISELVTPGYCCIIQGRVNDSLVRTETDRLVSGQLRQLGAEVFQQGVPVVLVVPPLPSTEFDTVIFLVAKALGHGTLISRSAWLTLIEKMRWDILEYGTFGRDLTETTTELAYDLCLYLGEVPDLRPAFRWFGWFRP